MAEIGPADPWVVREIGLTAADVDGPTLRQSESRFALANGHLGLRGELDEGDPCGMPGTYLNSVFETRDLVYPEEGYGFPQHTQTVVDAPNGKTIRLTVDGEPFDVRTGTLGHHERTLDLRAGTLHREVRWTSPGGVTILVSSTRLVSFVHASVAAIRYEVTAVDRDVALRIGSELRANEDQPEPTDDPRASAVLHRPFDAVRHSPDGLLHRTRRSAIQVAATVAHRSPARTRVVAEPDMVRTELIATVPAGQTLRVDKFLAYAWNEPDPWEKALADRDEAVSLGFDTLCAEQREFLDDFWDTADVELDGDPEVQQGVRFGLFHVLQAGAQAGPHPVAAKGLTGNGYDGHTLWDTETFVLPVLTYTHPTSTAQALLWRHRTLDAARHRAQELRLTGATYPWRTISGPECSGYWPAGTAALHVNADIAGAVLRYLAATDDQDFLQQAGLDILLWTARLWAGSIHVDDDGVAHIDGVTGPDEYTALVDDNAFTNLAARHNLLGAAGFADHLCRNGVEQDEIDRWRDLAERLVVPFSETRQVHEQHHGFTRFQEWDFDSTDEDEYPLFLHFPYLDLYRRQVVKQADLVLAMMLHGDAFTAAEKVRNFVYYEARTVRDSSLSAPAQAVLAAETGHLDLAHDYLAEAALLDLRAAGEAGGDGLHIASCAGAWTALVMGLGGMRDHTGGLAFSPRLPDRLSRLSFRLRWRDSRIRVTVTGQSVTYQVDGAGMSFSHHGEEMTLAAGGSRTAPVPPIVVRSAPPTPRPPATRASVPTAAGTEGP